MATKRVPSLRQQAENVAAAGRTGNGVKDTEIIHVNKAEASAVDALLKSMGGSGTVNPKTGKREYAEGGGPGSGKSGRSGGGQSGGGNGGGGPGGGGGMGHDPGHGGANPGAQGGSSKDNGPSKTGGGGTKDGTNTVNHNLSQSLADQGAKALGLSRQSQAAAAGQMSMDSSQSTAGLGNPNSKSSDDDGGWGRRFLHNLMNPTQDSTFNGVLSGYGAVMPGLNAALGLTAGLRATFGEGSAPSTNDDNGRGGQSDVTTRRAAADTSTAAALTPDTTTGDDPNNQNYSDVRLKDRRAAAAPSGGAVGALSSSGIGGLSDQMGDGNAASMLTMPAARYVPRKRLIGLGL